MHLPTSVVQLLFAVQLPSALYVGVRTPAHWRALLNWLVYGFSYHRLPAGGAVIALAISSSARGPTHRDGDADVKPYAVGSACLAVEAPASSRSRPGCRPCRPSGRRRRGARHASERAAAHRAGRRRARLAVVVPDAPATVRWPRCCRPCSSGSRGRAADEQICVVIGCGLHRPTTADEKAALVGAVIAARVHVVDAQGISQTSVALAYELRAPSP